jgi:hypothetical protein
LTVWLVADFEAFTYQDKKDFYKKLKLETSTATAINYTDLLGLGFVNKIQ